MKRFPLLATTLALLTVTLAAGCSRDASVAPEEPVALMVAWESDLAGRELNVPSAMGELLGQPSDALRTRLDALPVRYRYEVLDDGAEQDEGPSMAVWADQRDAGDHGVASLPLRQCGRLSVDIPAGRLVWGPTGCPESTPADPPSDALPQGSALPSLAQWPAPTEGAPVHGCRPEDLNAVVDGFGAAMGSVSARLVLQNVSGADCTLSSTPALQLSESGESRVIARHGSSSLQRTLAPNDIVTARLGWRAASRSHAEPQRIDALLQGHESFQIRLGTGAGTAPFTVDVGAIMEVSPFSAPSDTLGDPDAGTPLRSVAPPCQRDQLDASMSVTGPTGRFHYDDDGAVDVTTSARLELRNNWLFPCSVGGVATINAPSTATRVLEVTDAHGTIVFPTRGAGLYLAWDEGPTPPPALPWQLSLPGATLDLEVEGDTAWGLVGAEVTTSGWR